MLDGSLAVDSVTVVEVYAVDTKPGEGFEAGFTNVRGVRAEFASTIGMYQVGKFGGDEDVVSLAGAFEPFTDQIFAALQSTAGTL